jgi:hypothetical protein
MSERHHSKLQDKELRAYVFLEKQVDHNSRSQSINMLTVRGADLASRA